MEKLFGDILKTCRLESGIGLRELARMIRISPGYLSDVEHGRVPPPSETVIVALAQTLGVDKKILLNAAKKVDPELSEYVLEHPEAADFFRMAKRQEFSHEDWNRLTQLAKISRLGKEAK
jgi:transcriptional regulator with XRE-family HTH domain